MVNAAHAIADTLQKGVKEKAVLSFPLSKTATLWKYGCRTMVAAYPLVSWIVFSIPSSRLKAVGKGTGQGLAIVYSTVIDKHMGHIRCESEEGVGSTFILQFPLHSRKEG